MRTRLLSSLCCTGLLILFTPAIHYAGPTREQFKTELLELPAKSDVKDKIVYLEEVWKPLGKKFNVVEKGEQWEVYDNEGKRLFSQKRTENLQLKISNGQLYMHHYEMDARNGIPKGQTITLLKEDGVVKREVETSSPLMSVYLLPKMDFILFYGSYGLALGPIIPHPPVAYRISTGEEIKSDFPTGQHEGMQLLSRPDWKTVYMFTKGLFQKNDGCTWMYEYDQSLKKTFSHSVSMKKRWLSCVITDKDTIYMISLKTNEYWEFLFYDITARKLSSMPMPPKRGNWKFVNAMVDNKGKVITWGANGFIFQWPRLFADHYTRKKARTFKAPMAPENIRRSTYDTFNTYFFQKEGYAIAEDGRFVLVGYHPRQKERELFVYHRDGELIERIKLPKSTARKGLIKHLKFTGKDQQEVLVFAKDYTARVKLAPLPWKLAIIEKELSVKDIENAALIYSKKMWASQQAEKNGDTELAKKLKAEAEVWKLRQEFIPHAIRKQKAIRDNEKYRAELKAKHEAEEARKMSESKTP